MTAKLFTGGLDSKDEAKQLPAITGKGAGAGEKARTVGDGDNQLEDRYLKVPNKTSDLGAIDLSLSDNDPEANLDAVSQDAQDVEGSKVKARRARIKWTSGLLDRIAAVKEETGDVKDRVDRLSRRLKKYR